MPKVKELKELRLLVKQQKVKAGMADDLSIQGKDFAISAYFLILQNIVWTKPPFGKGG